VLPNDPPIRHADITHIVDATVNRCGVPAPIALHLAQEALAAPTLVNMIVEFCSFIYLEEETHKHRN
jgi:hypothetical protein